MTCLESSLVRMATRSDPAPSAMANNHSCQFWVDTLKNLLMGVTMMITCMSQVVQGMIAIPIRPVLENHVAASRPESFCICQNIFIHMLC